MENSPHMKLVGYASHIIIIDQFQEGGGDNLDLQELVAYQNSENTGEANSTNEGYKQNGRETTNQNPNSAEMSQRSTPSIMKKKTSGMDIRKTPIRSSDDGGDKNPPRKILEKTHVAHTPIKRKINMSSVEISTPEDQESPHAMDTDEIIEELDWSAQRFLETREIDDVIMTRDPEIFEEEFSTLNHRAYNCETKKLLLEKVNTKNKNSSKR
jgi:hypothetical protein